jgi:hypothetical protein
MGPVNPSKNFLNFYDCVVVVYTLKSKARNKNKFRERTFLILKKRTNGNPGTLSRGDGIFFPGAPKNKENPKKRKGH